MQNFIRNFLFSGFMFFMVVPLLNLSASDFSKSKQEMIAILEDAQLETLLGSDQSIFGIWQYDNSYWVWGSLFRYKVNVTYSQEGQIELEFSPTIRVIEN